MSFRVHKFDRSDKQGDYDARYSPPTYFTGIFLRARRQQLRATILSPQSNPRATAVTRAVGCL
jgi:hypothetical protein